MRTLELFAPLWLVACTAQNPARVVDGSAPDAGGPSVQSLDTAAAKYPDLRTLWARSVARTCGPNNGVCHDNRQFPDLQRASGLLDAINARCNQIRTDPATIDNLCEPTGDLLQVGAFQSRIGRVSATPAASPTRVTLTLRDSAPTGASGAISISRASAGLGAVSLPIPAAALVSVQGPTVTFDYAVLSDPARSPGPGNTTTVPYSMAQFLLPGEFAAGDARQVVMGDPNGDGIFGAELDGALVKPGRPLQSYLFLRLLSPLAVGGNQMTSMTAPAAQEAQMPIANFQYWDVDNDLTALWCWIVTMKPDGSNADGPIDYAQCSTKTMPEPTRQDGEATTFSEVYTKILDPYCRSCHTEGTREPTTFYLDDLQSAYDTLLGIRGSGPSESALPYVTKSDPSKSYLYLKISGDASIKGAKMPLGGALPTAADGFDAAQAIQTWIAQGANDD
jgi:hypothetical protein